MNAPWLGNMPGWREQGFWQYENEELDELGQRAVPGRVRQPRGAQRHLSPDDRAWASTSPSGSGWSTSSTRSRRPTDLTDVTRDVSAGPRTPYTLREASIPGKDELRVGNLWVWTERTTYNPVGGFGDAYSNDIWRNLVDPRRLEPPLHGRSRSRTGRATRWTTAGPDGTLDVPAGCRHLGRRERHLGAGRGRHDRRQLGHLRLQQVPLVPTGTTASPSRSRTRSTPSPRASTSRTTRTSRGSRWPSPPRPGRTSRPSRAMRILDDDRVEVYVDFWHFDEDQIAAYASPTSFSMPWEVLAAMDDLVFEQRRAAYSDTAACARQRALAEPGACASDARLVDRTLRQFATRAASSPRACSRWATGRWSRPRRPRLATRRPRTGSTRPGNLVISNGPVLPRPLRPGRPVRGARRVPRPDATRSRPATSRSVRRRPWSSRPSSRTSIGLGQDAVIPVTVEGPGTIALQLPAHRSGRRHGEGVRRRRARCHARQLRGDAAARTSRAACSRACTSWSWPPRAMRWRSSASGASTSRWRRSAIAVATARRPGRQPGRGAVRGARAAGRQPGRHGLLRPHPERGGRARRCAACARASRRPSATPRSWSRRWRVRRAELERSYGLDQPWYSRLPGMVGAGPDLRPG